MATRLHGTAGSWTLPAGRSCLGRGEACAIRLPDPRLSRRHAEVIVEGGVTMVEDLGSANPILLNGDAIAGRTVLTHGDALVVGPYLLRVEITAAPDPEAVSATQGTQVPGEADVPPVPRTKTQAMDAQEVAALADDSKRAKALDPSIAAALGRPTTRRERMGTSRLAPSVWGEDTVSGPLTAVMPDAPPAMLPPSTKTAFFPGDAPSKTSALTPGARRGLPPLVVRRILAVVLDAVGLLTLAVLVAALPLGWGLSQVAQALEVGFPTDFSGAIALVRQGWGQGAAFPGLFVGLSGAAIAIELIMLFGTVVATVRHGAPFFHRRLGLVIVVRRNGHQVGWLRALARWSLFGLLWPVAVISVWRGVRSEHDRFVGTEVRLKSN